MTERFQLIEEVGRGAMGVVWKARDNERGKIVAIKMLRDLHAGDPEFIERFAREVDLARSVRSPHVVRVRGYGARDAAPFVVMEFVAGRSLRACLAEDGPFPRAEARDLLAQIADALAAVHAAGIVHRDVKASNVLLTDDGVAKLTDFGIARVGASRGQTSHGSLLGTPAYMAPEGPVDARSDLYSLGVLYFELLAGVLPFTSADYREVIRAHVEAAPDLSRLPATERGLTGWLMSKRASERPQSAEVLLKSLRASGAAPTGNAAGRPYALTSSPTSSASPAREADGGSWTVPPAPVPTPTPTPTPAPLPLSRPLGTQQRYEATRPPSAALGARHGTQQVRPGVLVLGLLALGVLGAVVVYAMGTEAQPQQGSTGAPAALVLVGVVALGAIAMAATLAMSRARARASRNHDQTGRRGR